MARGSHRTNAEAQRRGIEVSAQVGHRDRKVRPIALVPDVPDPKATVVAEFDKGREMSRRDVAAALHVLQEFKGKADSTVEDAAKDIINRLEGEGAIRQTQKPAKNRPALYRKTDTGKVSA